MNQQDSRLDSQGRKSTIFLGELALRRELQGVLPTQEHLWKLFCKFSLPDIMQEGLVTSQTGVALFPGLRYSGFAGLHTSRVTGS